VADPSNSPRPSESRTSFSGSRRVATSRSGSGTWCGEAARISSELQPAQDRSELEGTVSGNLLQAGELKYNRMARFLNYIAWDLPRQPGGLDEPFSRFRPRAWTPLSARNRSS